MILLNDGSWLELAAGGDDSAVGIGTQRHAASGEMFSLVGVIIAGQITQRWAKVFESHAGKGA